jgi:radical SAM protein with 4Fe4S-binding SPASM domain
MLAGELDSGRARQLTYEIAALRPAWVIVEGGEALLRPDLFELLALMRKMELEIHLISNGMCLNSETVSHLKKLGIRLAISIDSARPDIYESLRGGASFRKVVEAALECSGQGILEAINTTIMKSNQAEIGEIFQLAESIGVGKINFIGLKPCESYPEELLSAGEYREAIRRVCQASRDTGIEFFFDEPFFWATVRENGYPAHLPRKSAGILLPSTTACIFGQYLFIEPDGAVKPCSFAPMVLGNVADRALGEIWTEACNSSFLQQIIATESRRGGCRECRHLAECKGCRSRSFVLTGDWLASDPVCPLNLESAVRKEF